MKLTLRIVLALVIGFIFFGIYINSSAEGDGEKFIGIGVLIFAFVLMPLFIYHRYNGRDLSQYSLKNLFQPGNKIEDVIKRNEKKND